MKNLLVLFVLLQLGTYSFAQEKTFDIKGMEKTVKGAIKKAYAASVRITTYDSATKTAGLGHFSGVVIDAAGHILSACHAVRPATYTQFSETPQKPSGFFEITFPNGQKAIAKALGSIPSNDAAMLQIIDKGNWPYAEMGWSSVLEEYVPCISIAYAGALITGNPTVRFGYVAEKTASNGFMRSTCLMEPGDSGGPLFDMNGRVIGLHSRVNEGLLDNFEIPVDLYRTYWTALCQPVNYTTVPKTDHFDVDPAKARLVPVPQLQNAVISTGKVMDKMNQTVYSIKSTKRDIQLDILGTLADLTGLAPKTFLAGKSFLISKSSMVGDHPVIDIGEGKTVEGKIINRYETDDLVLIQIDQEVNGGVKLKSPSIDSVGFTDLGTFLISPQTNNQAVTSIISNKNLSIAAVPDPPYLGISVKFENGEAWITKVQPGSPANSADLEAGDQLLGINGKNISTAEEFKNEMALYKPMDTIVVRFAKGQRSFSKRIVLRSTKPPMPKNHIAYQFTDGRSDRYDGFYNVLVHDAKLKPGLCGGPLYNTSGQLYGINIARLSRTTSLAVPKAAIIRFINASVQKATKKQRR